MLLVEAGAAAARAGVDCSAGSPASKSVADGSCTSGIPSSPAPDMLKMYSIRDQVSPLLLVGLTPLIAPAAPSWFWGALHVKGPNFVCARWS